MEASPYADKIMEFTLRHVPFDGWTIEALKRGAVDAGENPDDAVRHFQARPLNMIEYYSRMLDRQVAMLAEQQDISSMKVRDRIAKCVMLRLNLMGPYREAAQKAAVILSLPQNTPLASKLVYSTVNTIWHCAGDDSTDYNFYTKRALLSFVYSSTLLYWFRDISAGYANTQEFLYRRLENVMAIPKIKSQVNQVFETITKPLKDFLGRH